MKFLGQGSANMKYTSVKLIVFVSYILLLLVTLNFKISLLINMKMLLAIIIGTFLLSFLDYIKKVDKQRLMNNLKQYLIITGFMTTFLAQISLLSGNLNNEDMFFNIVKNFLPIFYAFIIYLAIDIFIDIDESKNCEIKEVKNNELKALDFKLEDFDLTKREISLAMELLKDLSNKEIADTLFISENTVKKHIQNIFKKTEVKNRTEFINKFRR